MKRAQYYLLIQSLYAVSGQWAQQETRKGYLQEAFHCCDLMTVKFLCGDCQDKNTNSSRQCWNYHNSGQQVLPMFSKRQGPLNDKEVVLIGLIINGGLIRAICPAN